MDKDEALKMVIKNLELQKFNTVNATLIAYCKEALATNKDSSLVQLAQEPAAWATEWEDGEWGVSHSPNMGKQSIPLYTKEHHGT